MRTSSIAFAALSIICSTDNAYAVCTKVCDALGCRYECPDKFWIQRTGEYYKIEVPSTDLSVLNNILENISSQPVVNTQKVDQKKYNIIIMSAPKQDADKIVQSLTDHKFTVELPQ